MMGRPVLLARNSATAEMEEQGKNIEANKKLNKIMEQKITEVLSEIQLWKISIRF